MRRSEADRQNRKRHRKKLERLRGLCYGLLRDTAPEIFEPLRQVAGLQARGRPRKQGSKA
jgi:hypothetical protein